MPNIPLSHGTVKTYCVNINYFFILLDILLVEGFCMCNVPSLSPLCIPRRWMNCWDRYPL